MNNTVEEVAELNSFKFIENLLDVLFKTKKVSVPVADSLIDTATAVLPTFVGGLVGGKFGAAVGSVIGSGIVVSRAFKGNHKYKSLMAVLREDLTEEERNNLYEKIWEIVKAFIATSTIQTMRGSTLTKLSKTIEENSEAMDSIKEKLNEIFCKKDITLA